MPADTLGDLTITVGGDISPLQASLEQVPSLAQKAATELDSAMRTTAVDSLDTSVKGLSDDLLKLPPVIHEVGSAAGEAQTTVGQLGDKLVEIAAAVVAYETLKRITDSLIELGEAALEDFGKIQRAEIALDALGGSAQHAGQIIEGLRELAVSDALKFEPLVEAQQRMTAFGFAAGQIPAALRAIADAAAATNRPFDAVANAFDRIVLSGAANARFLATLGLTLTDLGNAMGLTADQARKAFVALDESERLEVMTAAMRKMSGVAQEAAQGLLGSWQRVRTEFSFLVEDLGKSLEPAFASLLHTIDSSILPALKDLEQSLAVLAKDSGPTLVDVLNRITKEIGAQISDWALLARIIHGFDTEGLQGVIKAVEETGIEAEAASIRARQFAEATDFGISVVKRYHPELEAIRQKYHDLNQAVDDAKQHLADVQKGMEQGIATSGMLKKAQEDLAKAVEALTGVNTKQITQWNTTWQDAAQRAIDAFARMQAGEGTAQESVTKITGVLENASIGWKKLSGSNQQFWLDLVDALHTAQAKVDQAAFDKTVEKWSKSLEELDHSTTQLQIHFTKAIEEMNKSANVQIEIENDWHENMGKLARQAVELQERFAAIGLSFSKPAELQGLIDFLKETYSLAIQLGVPLDALVTIMNMLTSAARQLSDSNNAAAIAFHDLGMKSQGELNDLAQRASEDYKRIAESGTASAKLQAEAAEIAIQRQIQAGAQLTVAQAIVYDRIREKAQQTMSDVTKFWVDSIKEIVNAIQNDLARGFSDFLFSLGQHVDVAVQRAKAQAAVVAALEGRLSDQDQAVHLQQQAIDFARAMQEVDNIAAHLHDTNVKTRTTSEELNKEWEKLGQQFSDNLPDLEAILQKMEAMGAPLEEIHLIQARIAAQQDTQALNQAKLLQAQLENAAAVDHTKTATDHLIDAFKKMGHDAVDIILNQIIKLGFKALLDALTNMDGLLGKIAGKLGDIFGGGQGGVLGTGVGAGSPGSTPTGGGGGAPSGGVGEGLLGWINLGVSVLSGIVQGIEGARTNNLLGEIEISTRLAMITLGGRGGEQSIVSNTLVTAQKTSSLLDVFWQFVPPILAYEQNIDATLSMMKTDLHSFLSTAHKTGSTTTGGVLPPAAAALERGFTHIQAPITIKDAQNPQRTAEAIADYLTGLSQRFSFQG